MSDFAAAAAGVDVPAAASIAASRPGGAAEHALEILAAGLRPWIERANVILAFNAKEGYGSLAAVMPAHAVVDRSLGLQGAAWLALRHVHTS